MHRNMTNKRAYFYWYFYPISTAEEELRAR